MMCILFFNEPVEQLGDSAVLDQTWLILTGLAHESVII